MEDNKKTENKNNDIDDKTRTLDCWKVAVQQAGQVGERRSEVNTFFISIMTLISTSEFIGLSFSGEDCLLYVLGIAISIFGICMCDIWIKEMEHFASLLGVKHEIIRNLERKFGENVFRGEYHRFYCGGKSIDIDVDKYRGDDDEEDKNNIFGNKEKCIPKIFKGYFAFMIVVCVIQLFL